MLDSKKSSCYLLQGISRYQRPLLKCFNQKFISVVDAVIFMVVIWLKYSYANMHLIVYSKVELRNFNNINFLLVLLLLFWQWVHVNIAELSRYSGCIVIAGLIYKPVKWVLGDDDEILLKGEFRRYASIPLGVSGNKPIAKLAHFNIVLWILA